MKITVTPQPAPAPKEPTFPRLVKHSGVPEGVYLVLHPYREAQLSPNAVGLFWDGSNEPILGAHVNEKASEYISDVTCPVTVTLDPSAQ